MNQVSAFPDQRQTAILRFLATDGRVVAAELARHFATSEDTIRRDLRDLAAAGLCRRVYGGALPMSPASGSLRQRSAEAVDTKRALGAVAAALVQPGQTILIDAGSTNARIAETLTARGVVVITNAPAIAALLCERQDLEVIMLGGRVDPRTGSSFGARACAEVADLHVDVAFVGTCAVAPDGLAAFDPDEAAFKRLVVESADSVVAAVTGDKLLTRAPFRFAALGDLDRLVIEDSVPPDTLSQLGIDPQRVCRAATHSEKDSA